MMVFAIEAKRLGISEDDIDDEASLLAALNWILFRIPPSKWNNMLITYGNWPPELFEKAADTPSQDWITSRWRWASTALLSELKSGNRITATALHVLDWNNAKQECKGGAVEKTFLQLKFIDLVDQSDWQRPPSSVDWQNGYLMETIFNDCAHYNDGLFHNSTEAVSGEVGFSAIRIATTTLMEAFPAQSRPHPYIPQTVPAGERAFIKPEVSAPPAVDQPARATTGPKTKKTENALALCAAWALHEGVNFTGDDFVQQRFVEDVQKFWNRVLGDDCPDEKLFRQGVQAIKRYLVAIDDAERRARD